MAVQVIEEETSYMGCETEDCGYPERPSDDVRLRHLPTYEDARGHVEETGHKWLLFREVKTTMLPFTLDVQPLEAAQQK